MAYQMVATAVTLNDLEGHSPVADVFTCNPSNICAAFYMISTDIVLAWFLWISRASCQQLSQKTAIIFQLTQRIARFFCNSRASCFHHPVFVSAFGVLSLVTQTYIYFSHVNCPVCAPGLQEQSLLCFLPGGRKKLTIPGCRLFCQLGQVFLFLFWIQYQCN